MNAPTVAKIVEIGLNYPELGSREIMALFGVSRSTAVHYKKPVQEVMEARGIRAWSPRNINTKVAYEVWGFDLAEAERSLYRLTQAARSYTKI